MEKLTAAATAFSELVIEVFRVNGLALEAGDLLARPAGLTSARRERGDLMDEVTTIPVLPCVSMPETLAFYGALGFEVTHQQTTPNVYAATRRGDVHLHFMGLKKLDPRESYSTCLVLVPKVERLHETFAEGLRQAYGKVPIAGFPRISRSRGRRRTPRSSARAFSRPGSSLRSPSARRRGRAPCAPSSTRRRSPMRSARR